MLPWIDHYPDRTMAQLLIDGFKKGFLAPSFSRAECILVRNLCSARIYPDIVQDKISKEVNEGRVAGPFCRPPFVNFRLSPLVIVP